MTNKELLQKISIFKTNSNRKQILIDEGLQTVKDNIALQNLDEVQIELLKEIEGELDDRFNIIEELEEVTEKEWQTLDGIKLKIIWELKRYI